MLRETTVLVSCNFIKNGLQHKFFSVNPAISLRRPISKNTSERLLLCWQTCVLKIFLILWSSSLSLEEFTYSKVADSTTSLSTIKYYNGTPSKCKSTFLQIKFELWNIKNILFKLIYWLCWTLFISFPRFSMFLSKLLQKQWLVDVPKKRCFKNFPKICNKAPALESIFQSSCRTTARKFIKKRL